MPTIVAIRTAITNALAAAGKGLGPDEFYDSWDLELWSEAREAMAVPVLALKAVHPGRRYAEHEIPEVAQRLAICANALHALDPNIRMRPIGHHTEKLGKPTTGRDERDRLHNWSPINLDRDAAATRNNYSESDLVYVSFENISHRDIKPLEFMGSDPVAADPRPTIRAYCGDTMASVAERAHRITSGPNGDGYTLPILPAPNVLSLGGVLAISAHGSRLSFSEPEETATGHREWPGTISASVDAATVIAWNASSNAYEARRLSHADPELPFVAASLGRVIIVDVTLRVMPDYCLDIDLSVRDLDKLFGSDDTNADSVEQIAQKAGFEVLAFRTGPLAKDQAHVLEWRKSDLPPTGRWKSEHPLDDIISGGEWWAPILTLMPWWAVAPEVHRRLDDVADGIAQRRAADPNALPSPAGDQRMYAHSDAMPVEASGWGLIIPRRDLQKAASAVYELAIDKLDDTRPTFDAFSHRHLVFECRCANLDDVGLPGGAAIPNLSLAAPYPGRPGNTPDPQDAHIVLWVSVLYLTRRYTMDTHGEYFSELESEIHDLCDRQDWILRPEWAKGWGYTHAGGWNASASSLQAWFERAWPGDENASGSWKNACKLAWDLDPQGMFSSAFHDKILPKLP
jgi:hypothetical protein